eukprot:NODE_373_length_8576_cov_0.988557.p7 type:complete len:169 gc:universal NODE_373_length_8576_cov_0.988557:6598-7104(+)
MSQPRISQNNELSFNNARRIARQICKSAIRTKTSPIEILNTKTLDAPLRAWVIDCMEARLLKDYERELGKHQEYQRLKTMERHFNQSVTMRSNRLARETNRIEAANTPPRSNTSAFTTPPRRFGRTITLQSPPSPPVSTPTPEPRVTRSMARSVATNDSPLITLVEDD